MTKNEQICAYLESMAEKAGGDVRVYCVGGKYFMHRKGNPDFAFRVSMEETREAFNDKVKILMEG